MTIPFDRPLTPTVLREYADRLENIEREYKNAQNVDIWIQEFDETIRNLDFEVFNMCDSHDITRCTNDH